MTTYEVQSESASCIIWQKRDFEPREIHSQIFALFNQNFLRDAEIMCDALNKFSERNANFDITATIAEQKN